MQSLQYFSNPYDLLDKLIKFNPRFIIIDEIPLTNNQLDEITVQYNPKNLSSKLSLHILSKKKIKNYLKQKNFILTYEKNCSTGIGGYNYKCLVFIKK